MITASLEGTERLSGLHDKVMKAVIEALRPGTQHLRSLVVPKTPVLTGALKAAWTEVSPTATGFSFDNTLDYSVIIEGGGYKKVGPGTVKMGSGIYSKKAPGGMVASVFADDKLLVRIADSIARRVREILV